MNKFEHDVKVVEKWVEAEAKAAVAHLPRHRRRSATLALLMAAEEYLTPKKLEPGWFKAKALEMFPQ